MFIRVEFWGVDGGGRPLADSEVIETSVSSFDDAVTNLLCTGFHRKNRINRQGEQITFYDLERRIMPGAIISAVPCNEMGYSNRDIERAKEEYNQRSRW